MNYSQNGWPALVQNSRLLHKWVVPGTDRYFVLRNGSAGFILAHFIMWFHEKIEKLNKSGEPWDEWAWAYRSVRGSSNTISNHASGTAVDLNATKHPLGVSGTFPRFKRARIHVRLVLYRNCIRWGGDYTRRKDEMHFEINDAMPGVEFVARRLANTPRGIKILDANPGQRKVIWS